jgi:dTDP-4-dehydrorhamnose 3,5-epimerase
MRAEPQSIPEVLLITPDRFGDDRGFFSETWSHKRYAEISIPELFVQDNHSLSREAGVVRGLHCQLAPSAQGKLIRVVRGAIWDVAIDIRHGSPTYGQHVAVVLSAENWQQLWIPRGFLHGFATLVPDTEVIYKVTAPYDPVHERAVIWNDPDVALPWPVDESKVVLSAKDAKAPLLADSPTWFHYGEA